MGSQTEEIAARAAALIVEEGLPYGAAKRQAAAQLGLGNRANLPDQATVLAAVRDYIALFCAEEQAIALQALRERAQVWMTRLTPFRPYIVGAVWNGTATLHSDIYLDLYCDDPKTLLITLMDQRVRFDESSTTDAKGLELPVFVIADQLADLNAPILVHLTARDWDDLRGQPKNDAQGQPLRGSLEALIQKMEQTSGSPSC